MPRAPQESRSICWMVLTGILAVGIIAIAKHLAPHFHPFQLMFFYALLGALILTPVMFRQRQTLLHHFSQQAPHPLWWKLQVFRALCEFTAFSLSFYSVQHLMLPTQSAISFSSPIFASVFAIILLKETPHSRLWAALALGLLGVLVISNPFSHVGALPLFPVLAATLAAVLFGLCGALIRRLSHLTPPLVIAYMMLTLTALIALPFAIGVWQPLAPAILPWLLLFGMCTAGVQYSVSQALSLAPVTRIAPFTYLNLLWATLFSYVFFSEVITMQTLLGSMVILYAVIVALKR